MDPNKQPVSDSAILFLDTPFGEVAPSTNNPPSTSNSMDGHQILNQVQLQFIPTGNENAFVSGQMNRETNSNIYNVEPSVVVTGSMENQRNRDTDFLVDDTQPIDLGSPIRSPNDNSSSNGSKFTVWQFDFYAKFFDITSDIFFQRVIWSPLPLTGGDKGTYIDRYIHTNPDLYGPFWIPLTLAFTISICDDIIKHMNSWTPSSSISNHTISNNMTTTKPYINHFTYHPLAFEFDRLNMAMTITFSYVILAPLILWSFCQWRHCTKLYTFIECLCAYGYSLSLFIPVTVLALVNIRQIQFILFASAAFLSGSVLLISFAPVVHSDPSRSFKFAYVSLIFILLSHLILALFYLYMFL